MISLIFFVWLCTVGAFAGMAQTLTCTFQFSGSGTLGGNAFTNANIVLTTVGDTNNRQPAGAGGYYINNTSASIAISGVGSFQFRTPPPTGVFLSPSNPAPGSTVTEYVTFGSRFGLSTAVVFGTFDTTNPWYMLSSIGPISLPNGFLSDWNSVPISTTGGIVNLYDTARSIPISFQAALTGGIPAPVLSRSGVLSHIAAGGGWTTVISLVNQSSSAVPVTVTFHSDDGSMLALPVTVTNQGTTQTSTAATVNAQINPNATLLLSSGDGLSLSSTGWADVLSSGVLDGFAVFRWMGENGWPVKGSEGTVSLLSQYASTITVPYDNTAGSLMGVALANLSTSFAITTATIRDDQGNQIGTQALSMAGNGHTSFVLSTQMPITAGKRGIVQFQSSATGGLSGLGLQFTPFGTFTSVPTM